MICPRVRPSGLRYWLSKARSDRGVVRFGLLPLLLGATVAGAVAGGVLSSAGVLRLTGTPPPLPLDAVPLYDCPDGNRAGELRRGDRLLATARDPSGRWIEIRSPADLNDRVWMEGRFAVPDASFDDLPTVECELDTATETPPPTPSPTPLVTPGPRTPGSPTPSPPTPSPVTDVTGPSIAGLTTQPGDIWEQWSDGYSCEQADTSAVSAQITDPSGVQSVEVSWSVKGAGGSRPMQPAGDRWSALVGPFSEDTVTDNEQAVPVSVTVIARDEAGNSSSSTTTLTLHNCFRGVS